MLCFFQVSALHAQTITASGQVVAGDDLRPVSGATIVAWKGQALRALTTTDKSGNFSVKLNPGEEIEVSHTGFTTTHMLPSDTMLVVLQRLASDMTEVMVVGYQKKAKETVTGAVTRITADDIKDVPTSNLEELMQGRVPGLNVQMNTGAPGFRGAATIRGLSSIGASGAGADAYVTSNSPLYIVDGVPIDADAGFEYGFQSIGPGTSPLSLIPVEDIETVDVMLDAQATSLYGSRGANGVIVITTKKGKSRIPIVTYIGNYFVNSVPPLRNTIGGREERELRVATVYGNGDYNYIYQILNRPFISDSLNPFYNNSTDWQGIYYTPTYNHSHNVSIAGGDQILNYKTNLNFYSDRGVIRNTGFDRYAATMSLGFNPNDRFRVNAQVFAAIGKKLKGSGNGLTEVGAGSNIASSLMPGPSFFLDVSQFSGAIYSSNDAKTHNFRSFIDVSYELIKNVRISSNTSYDYTQDSEDFFKPAAADANRTRLFGLSARRSDLYNRSQLNYSGTFGEKHNLYTSVFSELRVNNSTGYVIENRNGPNDYYWGPLGYNSWYSNYSGVQSNGGASNQYTSIHTIALAANMQYNFNKKYILDLAFRQDGSSYAGENNRWARNPSMGLRWNIEKEKFMEKVSWVTSAALRFTYGVNLRPTTNIYASQGQFGVRGAYNNVIRVGPVLGYLPNPDLRPEKVETINIGGDFYLFSNRVGLTFNAYEKNVDDLIYETPLADATGFQKTFTNDAALTNRGLEVSLTFRPAKPGKDFNWNVYVNGSAIRQIIRRLPGNALVWFSDGRSVISRVGGGQNNFLLVSDGVFADGASVPVDPVTGLALRNGYTTSYFQAGDMHFRDVDGNYIIDDNDLQVGGKFEPIFTGGFGGTIMYKNFNLTISGAMLFDRTLRNNALSQRLRNYQDPLELSDENGDGAADGPATFVDISNVDYYTVNRPNAKYPNPFLVNTGTNSLRDAQTLFEEDGSYIKFNTLILGYNFNRAWLDRHLKLRNARLYLTVKNPLLLSGYSGPNPETVNSLGRDYLGNYPNTRAYTLGANIEF